jgi:uncharacterized cupin superfamily protein
MSEHLNVHTAAWEPFPEFGGQRATLYESADGTRFAASYRLSGRHTWTLQYDDYFYVIAGHATITVDGQETFEVASGDFCRLRQGATVTFDMSEDFHEVSVLVGMAPFTVTDH